MSSNTFSTGLCFRYWSFWDPKSSNYDKMKILQNEWFTNKNDYSGFEIEELFICVQNLKI